VKILLLAYRKFRSPSIESMALQPDPFCATHMPSRMFTFRPCGRPEDHMIPPERSIAIALDLMRTTTWPTVVGRVGDSHCQRYAFISSCFPTTRRPGTKDIGTPPWAPGLVLCLQVISACCTSGKKDVSAILGIWCSDWLRQVSMGFFLLPTPTFF